MSTISAYTGDGSTTQFDITFTYRSATTVKASLDGVETEDFSFVNPSRIAFDAAPANGAEIKIFRRTSVATPEVEFEDGAIIRGDDLNDAIAQPRDRVEELDSDVADISGAALRAPAGETLVTLPDADTRANKYILFDADGVPSVSTGTGTDTGLRTDLAAEEGGDLVRRQLYTGGAAPAITRRLWEELSIYQVAASKAVIDEWQAGTWTANDTEIVAEALANAKRAIIPRGRVNVAELAIPTGKALVGQGRNSILQLASGGNRPLVMSGVSDFELADLVIDGLGNAAFHLGLFDGCANGLIQRVGLTGAAAYGLQLEACENTEVRDIHAFGNVPADPAYAALYISGLASRSEGNRVRGLRFDSSTGRALFVLDQDNFSASGLFGFMDNGEIALLEGVVGFNLSNVTWIGPGTGNSSLSDGTAFNGDTARGVFSNFLGINSSGHGVSANGTSGRDGARDIVISNGLVIAPNEGGVIVSDQGVAGSIPDRITVANVRVVDAGRKVASENFGVTGGTNVRFRDCVSEGTSGVSGTGTTYGFLEFAGGSGNVPSGNSFEGEFLGTFNTGTYSLSSTSSRVRDEGQDKTTTWVLFDGDTGGTATVIAGSNIASVVRNGEGDYTINFINELADDYHVSAIARAFGGNNQVTLIGASATGVQIQVHVNGTPNDSDRVRLKVS